MRLFRELEIVYLLPVLCCSSASCHRGAPFPQETSQSPPLSWILCVGRYLLVRAFLLRLWGLRPPNWTPERYKWVSSTAGWPAVLLVGLEEVITF